MSHSFDTFWTDRHAWSQAARNTFTCLIGCSMGDFATIIVFQLYWPQVNMFVVMGLAMIMGLVTSLILETLLLKFKEKFASWKAAIKMAASMSLLSMIVMELAENITDYALTQGMTYPSDPFYWIALGISLIAGFLVPLPYNYYKFKKYGHACCHVPATGEER